MTQTPPTNTEGAVTELAAIAAAFTPGSARAVSRMTDQWQFCGRSTFDANGAYNAHYKAKSVVERANLKDGKWSRHGYRLTPLGLLVKAHLTEQGVTASGCVPVTDQEMQR